MKNKQDIDSIFNNFLNSPTFTALRNTENVTEIRRILNHQQFPDVEKLIQVSNHYNELTKTLNSSDWLHIKTGLDTLSTAIPNIQKIVSIASIKYDLANLAINIHNPVLPDLDNFNDIVSANIKFLDHFGLNLEELHKNILARAEYLKDPWVLSGMEALSVSGCVKLSCFSKLAHSSSPFEGETASFYNEQLYVPENALEDTALEKDELAIKSGLNLELIAFFPPEYSHVLEAAGFDVFFSYVSVPISEGAKNDGEAYNAMHDALLKQVEILLRQLIEKKLHAISGDSWIEIHVSESCRNQWRSRQKYDQKCTGKHYSLIHYSNIMDLKNLICDSNNWDSAFGDVFTSKEDFRVSMTRLHPIRNCIAHARPLARAEVLVLVTESSRLLTVLRRVLDLTSETGCVS